MQTIAGIMHALVVLIVTFFSPATCDKCIIKTYSLSPPHLVAIREDSTLITWQLLSAASSRGGRRAVACKGEGEGLLSIMQVPSAAVA